MLTSYLPLNNIFYKGIKYKLIIISIVGQENKRLSLNSKGHSYKRNIIKSKKTS